MRARIDRSDGGYATVWVIAAMGLVVSAGAVGVGYGAAVTTRHRAGAAADSSALVAALRAIDGPAAACADSAALAVRNGGTLSKCQLDGSVAQVTVSVALPGPLAACGPAVGRARAGPVAMAPVAS